MDFMVLLTDTLDMQASQDAEGWNQWCSRSTAGLWIINQVERLDTLALRPDAALRLRFGDGGIGNDTVVTTDVLARALAGEARDGHQNWYGITQKDGVSGHMTIEGGTITSFDQQYFP